MRRKAIAIVEALSHESPSRNISLWRHASWAKSTAGQRAIKHCRMSELDALLELTDALLAYRRAS